MGWKFDTALEAAYPDELCVTYADLAADIIQVLPSKPGIAPSEPTEVSTKSKLRASVGMFVRGNKYPPLISEFLHVSTIPAIGRIEPGALLELSPGVYSKVLKCVEQTGTDSGAPFSLKVGTYRLPESFIQETMKLRHPIDSPSFLPEALARNVFAALTTHPKTLATARLERIKLMRKWALELGSQNKKLLQSLDVPKARILCDKHLVLMGKVLEHINYPDQELINDLAKGTVITGRIAQSNIFMPRELPATTSSESLLLTSPSTRKSVIARIVSSGDKEIDDEVWAETIKETDRQWLSSEMDLDELERLLGPLFVIAKRFGIRQSGKIRAIDDYSISGANSAATTTEKLDLLGNDEMFALLKLVISSVADDGSVNLTLPSGEVLSGKIPEGFTPQMARDWLGKTFDLKSAYRQIPTCRDGTNPAFTVIGVFNPISKRPAYFLQYATPFGAVSSVYLF